MIFSLGTILLRRNDLIHFTDLDALFQHHLLHGAGKQGIAYTAYMMRTCGKVYRLGPVLCRGVRDAAFHMKISALGRAREPHRVALVPLFATG